MKKLRHLAISLLFALMVSVTAILVACGGDEQAAPPVMGAEAGVYYYEDELLSLTGYGEFALTVGSSSKTGRYTVSGGEIAFKYSAEADGTMVGTIESNAITVTYNGAVKRYYRQEYYTVTFDSKGGSYVGNLSVLNGSTLVRPQNPTYSGKTFIGWYNDEAYTSPFTFRSDIITSDKTLYAYWVDNVFDVEEYVVDFDLGYEGAEEVPSQTTIGGRMYIFPEVEGPDGSTLAGWWVSALDSKDPEKLTYKYENTIVLKENTTLHAVWTKPTTGGKLAAPLASVYDGTVSWNPVTGAAGYIVTVTSPSGAIATREVPGTSTAVDMTETGEYIVTVKARATSAANNSDETVRHYVKNKLARVSLFTVIGSSTLVYNAVEGAEKYLITVNCGNEYHNHTDFDNGTSTYFNFRNCDMGANGIEFVVTAVAPSGKLSSVSRMYVYKNVLDAVRGFTYDAENQLVSWPQVFGATEYYVSIAGGAYVSIGNKNYVSLKEYTAEDGVISVKVYPATNGAISPAPTEYKAAKPVPPTPAAVTLNGLLLTWNEVAGATYEVTVGEQTIEVKEGTSLDLSAEEYEWVAGTNYAIKVRAVVGGKTSAWSDELSVRYGAMSGELTYVAGTVRWNPVLGADSYEVTVNDGTPVIVEGATQYRVNLGRAGLNTIAVRALVGEVYTKAISTEVFAYAIALDSRGGSEVVRYAYKAIGDINDLPVPTKYGYTFEGWYNTPSGADSNGRKYNDKFFNEAGEIVLYAYYTPNTYKVNYDYLGGTGTELDADVTYSKNYRLAVPYNELTGGIFGGWWSNPNGIGVQYTDENGYSLGVWDEANNKTLYAYWIEDVLRYNLLADGKSYSVQAGSKISSVTKVRVPTMYRGLPVTTIEASAFANCTNLITIEIPESITLISSVSPFAGCTALEAVNVYEVEGTTNPRYWSQDGVVIDNGLDQSATVSILLVPAARTGSYRIPDGVTTLASGVFTASLITELIIPETVARIETEALYNCVNLTSIVFESGSANAQSLVIGARAFFGSKLITEITLPARLSVIELTRNTYNAAGSLSGADMQDAFIGCSALANIYVEAGNKNYSAKDGLLYNANGTKILYAPVKWAPPEKDLVKADEEAEEQDPFVGAYVIPAGVTEIGDGAFLGTYNITNTSTGAGSLVYNTNLKKLVVPNYVRTIGNSAFYGTSALTDVKFEGDGLNNVTIGNHAFRSSGVKNLVFEEGTKVSTIGDHAFRYAKLVDLTIPANVSKVGSYAFANMTTLKTVEFAENGVEISFSDNVFNGDTGLTTISFPSTLKVLALGVFNGCTNLAEVIIAEENQYYTSVDGIVYDKALTTALFCPKGKDVSNYRFPDTVTTIGDGFLKGNTASKGTIYIGKNVEYIGNNAFESSGFTAIEFEEGGESKLVICERAFYAVKFTTVVLPARTSRIEKESFYGQSSVSTATLKSITLNEGLEEIGDSALENQRLSELVIPSTVKTIGNKAIATNTNAVASNTFSSLTFAPNSQLVYIGSNAFQYQNITEITLPASLQEIGASVFYFCNKLERVDFEPGAKISVFPENMFNIGTTTTNNKLKYVKVPASVELLESKAFPAAVSLETVEFEEGEKDLVFGSTSYTLSSTLFDIASGASSTLGVFYNSTATAPLKSLTLPARTKIIGVYAFGLASLNTVNFAENCRLERIYPLAFNTSSSANALTSISLENCQELKVISDLAFAYSKLTHIKIPASVQDYGGNYGIGTSAFRFNQQLVTLEFMSGESSGALTIGEYAFQSCTKLENMTLPSNFARIAGENTFNNCPKLNNFTVNDDNKRMVAIEGVAYALNKNGEPEELVKAPANLSGTITVPNTVRKVGPQALQDCVNVDAIIFADGAPEDAEIEIGAKAFAGCTKITSLVFPSGTVSVGTAAFDGCTALKSVTISKKMKLTGFNAADIFGEKCKALEEILVEEGSKDFMSDNGVLYDAPGLTLIFYPSARPGATYDVLEGTTSILAYAFRQAAAANNRGTTYLTTVNVPASLTTLYERSFAYFVGIQYVNFADGCKLKEIPGGSYPAFYNMTGLKALRIPAGVKELTGMPSSTGSQFISATNIEEITFEEGSQLTTIGQNTFRAFTKLKRIVFPKSLEELGWQALKGCTSLTEVVFPDGCNLKTIGSNVFDGCTALTSIRIPAATLTTGSQVFNGCYALAKITFESGSRLQTVGDYGFSAGGTLASNSQASSSFQSAKAIQLTEIEIPSTVTSIGNYAFAGCYLVKSIKIPDGVTSIGNYVFTNCYALTDLRLPKGIKSVGENAFLHCEALTSVDLSNVETIGNYAFAYTGITSFDFTAYPALTTVGNYVFKNGALTSVKLPGSDVTVGTYTFQNCAALATVNFDEQTTAITNYLFSGCTGLKSINIPGTVDTIGQYAFSGCTALNSVTISEGVTKLDNYAFQNCSALTSIELPSTVETLGTYVFSGTGLTSFVVPESITALPNFMFSSCTSLTEVVLHDGILTLGTNVFDGCTVLKSVYVPSGEPEEVAPNGVYLPDGVTSIGNYAFRNASAIEHVEMPNTVATLGSYAFQYCTSLKSVELSNIITKIDSGTFQYCTSLEELVIPDTVTTISGTTTSSAFLGLASLTKLTIPFVGNSLAPTSATSKYPFGYIFGTTTPATYTTSSLFTQVTQYYGTGSSSGKYWIPKSLTEITVTKGGIWYGAFMAMTSLKVIDLTGNMAATSIGQRAFDGCTALTTVKLSTVTSEIEASAFKGCTALTGIDLTYVKTIGANAFENCTGITSLTVPASVTSIGKDAFKGWTEGQTIIMACSEEEKPTGFDAAVANSNAKVKWNGGEETEPDPEPQPEGPGGDGDDGDETGEDGDN